MIFSLVALRPAGIFAGDRRDCREAIRTVLLLCYLVIIAILYNLHGASSFI